MSTTGRRISGTENLRRNFSSSYHSSRLYNMNAALFTSSPDWSASERGAMTHVPMHVGIPFCVVRLAWVTGERYLANAQKS